MTDTFPKTDTDKKLVKKIKDILEKHEKLSTRRLAEQIDGNEIAFATAKSKLHTHREEIEKGSGVETKEEVDGTPGNTTVYWRLV